MAMADESWWVEDEIFNEPVAALPNISATIFDVFDFDDVTLQLYINAAADVTSNPPSSSRTSDEGFAGTTWRPLHIEAYYFPELITILVQGGGERKFDSRVVKEKVKKHLIAIGWKIECKRSETSLRIRYISPAGKIYYSLPKACHDLLKKNDKKHENRRDHIRVKKEDNSTEGARRPNSVREYKQYMDKLKRGGKTELKINGRAKTLRLHAKQHLVSSGWKLWMKMKKTKPEACYTSPIGKSYYSLYTACVGYLEE